MKYEGWELHNFDSANLYRAYQFSLIRRQIKGNILEVGPGNCIYANKYMKNGDFDFYPSLSSQDKQEYSELFLSKLTNTINSSSPSSLGLTRTGNGPIPANHPAFHLQNLNM